jgi:hypothetical protein
MSRSIASETLNPQYGADPADPRLDYYARLS